VPTFRLICLILLAASAARADPADLCRDVAVAAADRHGIPPEVLLAVTLTETGRSVGGALQPWPWAINHAGDGAWYPTEADAVTAIGRLTGQGLRNFDVGCFQLNHRWHAGAFTSAEDMINPSRNADYAAQFLREKYADTQDWGLAAAAYHSGTPEYATQYQKRFEAILASLPTNAAQGDPIVVAAGDIPERPNAYPLLLVGQHGAGASIVPLDQSARPLFGAGG
jgi:hypothetical protein